MSRAKPKSKTVRSALQHGARVIVWARVSSREQREHGWSLPEQLREVRDFAAAQGWVVAHEFSVDESATRSEREVFLRMLEVAERDLSVAAILSIRLDRLSRNDPVDRMRLEALRRHTALKIRFVKETFDENAFGQFVFGLRQELAGLEVGLLKERIQEGFLGRAREGWYPHPPLWPYVSGDRAKGEPPIRLDHTRPERANLARRLFELVGDERYTPEDARKILADKEGYVYSASSRMIPRTKAYAFLRDRFAMGEFVFQNTIYPGKHEPIISRELWERTQAVLDGRSRSHKKGILPYNGLVRCAVCASDGRDAAMTCEAIKKKLKDGTVRTHGYLKCSMSGTGHGKKGCPVKRMRVTELERELGELLDSIAFDDAALEKIRAKLRESQRDHVVRVEKVRESHRRQVTQLEEKKRRAVSLALEGRLSGAILQESLAEIESDLSRARAEVARLEGQSRAFYDEGLKVLELAQRARRIWDAQDSAKKRQIASCLLSNLTWDGVSLAPEWRKPLGLVAEGLSLVRNRGAGI